MNSITSRKAVFDQQSIWGRKWWYRFRELPEAFPTARITNQIQSLEKRYAELCRVWNPEVNSEWICRIYLSAKMVLAATIQINSLKHAEKTNIRVVGPYLRYYSIFTLLRAIVFTIPEHRWNNGSLATLSHKKVLALSHDCIRCYDREWAAKLFNTVTLLRHQRELISYWHPSSGDTEFSFSEDLIKLATILAEIAQFNSEVLERAVLKKADRTSFVFLDEYAEGLSQTELVGHMHVDWDDAYRVDYLARKYPAPTNIAHTITEGHVDDICIAWGGKEPTESSFDPDENFSVIFDMP
mgnify:CR=1 FL=1